MFHSINNKYYQIIRNKEKIGNVLFIIGLCIELIVLCTDNCSSWTIPYRGRLVQLAFGLFCIKICTTKYSYLQWISMILLGIIGVISYCTTTEELVIRSIVFVFASKDVDVKNIIKIILIGTIASSIIIVLLALMGVCGQVADIRHYGRGIEEVRYNLGFNHANNVQDTLWMILLLTVMLRKDKFNWVDAIGWSMANIALYGLTVSRTGFIAIELVVVGCLISNYGSRKLYNIIVPISVVACTTVSIFLTILSAKYSIYDSKIEAFLDPILTGRLEMVSERTDLRNWSLLPLGYNSAEVDNGFAFVGYSYGYVILTLLIAVIFILIWKMYKNHEIKAEVLLLSVVLVIFMESSFIFNVSMICNMLLILVIVYWINGDLSLNKT